MGGLIALATAVEAPQRVPRLVVASTAGHLGRHGRRSLEMLLNMLRQLAPADFGAALMTLAFSPPFSERHPGFVAEATRLYGPDPEDIPGAITQLDRMLEGWDLRPRLARLDIPALVLAGARDPLVAVEDTRQLADALSASELWVVPEGAHSVLAEGGTDLFHRAIAFIGGASE
jgi:pimeloyl-ACP methyl ester carboxylesterase